MEIKEAQKNWDLLVGSLPGKEVEPQRLNQYFEWGVREIDPMMKYVESLGTNFSRKKAFDFGCGAGRLAQRLADYFDEVVGVDIAPGRIEQAQKYNRHGDRCRYYVNATDDLKQFADNSFNFIYSNITLQHIEPRYSKNYIKEFVRVLAPHGLLIFQLPSEPTMTLRGFIIRILPNSILSRLRGLLDLRDEKGWKALVLYLKKEYRRKEEMHGIKRDEVVQLLQACGAKIVDVQQDQNAGTGWVSFQYCVTKG